MGIISIGLSIRKDEIMIDIITHSSKETQDLGYRLGTLLKEGDIVCLVGDLGAGKTTLTQSIAKGLGVEDYVTSPTFTLINEYSGRYMLYHFDLYRLNSIDEIYDLGYEEYFFSQGVCIIEWADILQENLPLERLNIFIERGKEDNDRKILISGSGNRYREIIKELKK